MYLLKEDLAVAARRSDGDGGLPAGVTLQAIDGETMLTATTMSTNYWATRASGGIPAVTNNPSYPGMNWDNPATFPISTWFGLYTQDMPAFLGMKFNDPTITGMSGVSEAITGGGDYSVMVPNKATAIISARDLAPSAWGPWTLGQVTDDYATSTSTIQDEINANGAAGDGRMKGLLLGWQQIKNGSLGSVAGTTFLAANYFTKPTGGNRSIDYFSIDIYWFAIANDNGPNTPGQYIGGQICSIPMGRGPSLNRDQMARGSHYGNMIDCERAQANGTNPGQGDQAFGKSGAPSRIPLGGIVENVDGFWSQNPTAIKPPEMNWAIWSSIIHGARKILYFAYAAQGHGTSWFPTTIQGGQAISIHDQAVATNLLIGNLARVINSPFAKGYVSAVTPHGYLFPVYEQNWLNEGVECCVHWYQGGTYTPTTGPLSGTAIANGFYIFATTRYGYSGYTSKTAKFTINDPNATSAKVLGENRSIAISGGAFSDTFATPDTVHIYQIK